MKKKFLSLILSLSLIFACVPTGVGAAVATSGTCGASITWEISDDQTTLTISGTGEMYDYDNDENYSPWRDWGYYNITTINISDEITYIGSYAFYNYSSLTSITIPDSVTSIGQYAFSDCGLTNVTIPDGVTSISDGTFYGCTSLTSITIPAGVTSIGEGAFRDCTSLTSITIPAGVTSIGSFAFTSCSSLSEINVDSNNANYTSEDGILFNKDKTELVVVPKGLGLESYIIPDNVTTIGASALAYTSLKSVTIPSSVTTIGSSAFYSCTSLTNVTIADGVTTIGSSAFYNCKSLTNIILPDSITILETSVFNSCSSLKGITIPRNVTSIEKSSFSYCTSLTSVTIPDNVTSIGETAFSNCTSLTSVTIPNSVTSINRQAFYNCTSLTSVTIPNSVTSIGERVFYNCKSLTSVTIPDSVTSIGNYAFSNCTSLTTAAIGSNVISLGSAAFNGCSALTSVYINQSYGSLSYSSTQIPSTATVYWLPSSAINLSDVTVTDIEDSYVYTGDEITPVPTLTYGNGILEENTNYTLLYANNINVGTASVTMIGSSWVTDDSAGTGYTGTQMVTYTITALPLTDENVVIGGIDDSYAYTGEPITPELTVTYGGTALAEGTDYALSYVNNTDVGTATINILFQGNYSGSISKTFTIAPNGSCGDNVTWAISADGTKLVISGTGAMYDYNVPDVQMPWNSYLSSITSVSIGNGVTHIGDWAFGQCNYLENVTIPSSVVTIGNYAFYENYALTGITIPNNVTSIGYHAFDDCDALTSINIPDSVTSIGESAFAYCESLTSVTIGSGVISIGSSAFANCSSLSEINVDSDNENYTIEDGILFNKDKTELVVVPRGLGLESYIIPDNVTTIDPNAFASTSLKSVTIPDSVTSIGAYAFRLCTSLTTAAIGSGVTSLGAYAFSGCSNLASVYINQACGSLTYSKTQIPSTATVYWLPSSVIDISDVTVAGIEESYTYTGAAIIPELTLTYGDDTLAADTNYTLSYSDNVDVGTASVVMTGVSPSWVTADTDSTGYTGTRTVTYTITALPLTEEDVEIDGIDDSYTYTGEAFTPEPTVTYGETPLAEGTDYTVSYEDNTNAGTATVNITFKGNYSGSVSKTFTINQASNAITVPKSSYSVDYGSENIDLGITSSFGAIQYVSTNEKVASVDENGIMTVGAVGTATISSSVTATDNYAAATGAAVTVTVNAVAPSAPTIVSASSGEDGKTTIKWTAPESNGGSAVTGYIIQQSSDGENYTSVASPTQVDTTAVISGLTNGWTYYFRMFASNTAGTSGASNVVEATPASPTPTAEPTATPTAEPTATATATADATATPTATADADATATPTATADADATATPTATPTPTPIPSVDESEDVSGSGTEEEPYESEVGTEYNLGVEVGETDSVKYETSDDSVVTVDEDGNVTVVGDGDATITVTITDEDGNTTTETVYIVGTPSGFAYDITGISLGDGAVTVKFNDNFGGGDGELIVAVYDSSGRLTAVKFADMSDFEDGAASVDISTGGASYASAFIWDSIEKMAPMSKKLKN